MKWEMPSKQLSNTPGRELGSTLSCLRKWEGKKRSGSFECTAAKGHFLSSAYRFLSWSLASPAFFEGEQDSVSFYLLAGRCAAPIAPALGSQPIFPPTVVPALRLRTQATRSLVPFTVLYVQHHNLVPVWWLQARLDHLSHLS